MSAGPARTGCPAGGTLFALTKAFPASCGLFFFFFCGNGSATKFVVRRPSFREFFVPRIFFARSSAGGNFFSHVQKRVRRPAERFPRVLRLAEFFSFTRKRNQVIGHRYFFRAHGIASRG